MQPPEISRSASIDNSNDSAIWSR